MTLIKLKNNFLNKNKISAKNKFYFNECIKICRENNVIKNFKYEDNLYYNWNNFYYALIIFLKQFEKLKNLQKITLTIKNIENKDKIIYAMYDNKKKEIILNYKVLKNESAPTILMSLNHEYIHYLDYSLNEKIYNISKLNEPFSSENLHNNTSSASVLIKNFIMGCDSKKIKNKYSEKDFVESLLIYSLINKSEKLINKIDYELIDETMLYLFEILLKEQKNIKYNIIKYLNKEDFISEIADVEREFDKIKYRMLKKLKINKSYDNVYESNDLILSKPENDFYIFFSYLNQRAESRKFTKDERRHLLINTYYNFIYFNINNNYDLKLLNINTTSSNIFDFYNLFTINGNYYTEFLSPYLIKNIRNKNIDFNYITKTTELLAYSIETNANNLISLFSSVVFNENLEIFDIYTEPNYSEKEIKLKKEVTQTIRGFLEKYSAKNLSFKKNLKQDQVSLIKEEVVMLKRNLLNKFIRKEDNYGVNPFEKEMEKMLVNSKKKRHN